jgi:bifunctional non-homologous end joining protein LigD
VRLFTRRGNDWPGRYPLISEAARKLRAESFVIDGEAVWLGGNGLADFDALHAGKRNAEVRLVAFDLLAVGGDDIRPQPLHARKARLEKLLGKSGDGIQINEHLAGEIGAATLEHACKLGPEGIVSKHWDRAKAPAFIGGVFGRISPSNQSCFLVNASQASSSVYRTY